MMNRGDTCIAIDFQDTSQASVDCSTLSHCSVPCEFDDEETEALVHEYLCNFAPVQMDGEVAPTPLTPKTPGSTSLPDQLQGA